MVKVFEEDKEIVFFVVIDFKKNWVNEIVLFKDSVVFKEIDNWGKIVVNYNKNVLRFFLIVLGVVFVIFFLFFLERNDL